MLHANDEESTKMRLNILLSVTLLANIAIFSVGFKWEGSEDSDTGKLASATGGEWQVVGKRPKSKTQTSIARELANTIYGSAKTKINGGREFGFLYLNYDLNENKAVLEQEIGKKMPPYSKDKPPTMILLNTLYISEVTYPPAGEKEQNNFGHAEYKLLQVLDSMLTVLKNKRGSNCPLFVIVGTHLSPCPNCQSVIVKAKNDFILSCSTTRFYLFIGKKDADDFRRNQMEENLRKNNIVLL